MTFAVFVLALGGFAGFFIGCIGIGGVVLVPVLTLAGIDVHAAIAACMFSYMFCAAAGVWMFARKGSIDWSAAAWLCIAAMPGALFGAFAAVALSAAVLEAFIAAALLLSGLRAFGSKPESNENKGRRSKAALLAAGAVTGFLSALTGTSGPVVLVPILLWFDWPMLAVVGLSQAIQIPIAVLATFGNLAASGIDFELGLLLALGLTAATIAGAHAAHRMPEMALKRLAGCIMLAAGGVFVVRLLHQYGWPT